MKLCVFATALPACTSPTDITSDLGDLCSAWGLFSSPHLFSQRSCSPGPRLLLFSPPCRLCHQTLFLIHLQILLSVPWEHLDSQVCPIKCAIPLVSSLQALKAGPFAACLVPAVPRTARYGCVWAHIAPVCWPWCGDGDSGVGMRGQEGAHVSCLEHAAAKPFLISLRRVVG